jgi:hypothetical protein
MPMGLEQENVFFQVVSERHDPHLEPHFQKVRPSFCEGG